MREVMKTYRIRIKTMSPVFIGDGGKIGNREYIYLQRQHKIIVPALGAMFNAAVKAGKVKEFEAFMMGEKYPLGTWLRNQGFSDQDYEKWKKYELDAGDLFMQINKNTGKPTPPKDIQTFVKDPYGKPYIPGSSLKGTIRTALLAHAVLKDYDRYADLVQQIKSGSSETNLRRDKYLQRQTTALEQEVFHTLNRNDKKNDAVNSVMSGFIVSDSAPINTDRLTLCQKVDLTLDQHEKPLPILRECLKPETVVEFMLTLYDSFPFNINDIQEALENYNVVYYSRFGKKFHMGNPEPGILWLGGGVGFGAKTVINSLFGENEALAVTDRIFQATVRNYAEHHHNNDRSLGVSPHIYKCTRYQGTRYDMGMSKIVDLEEF